MCVAPCDPPSQLCPDVDSYDMLGVVLLSKNREQLPMESLLLHAQGWQPTLVLSENGLAERHPKNGSWA